MNAPASDTRRQKQTALIALVGASVVLGIVDTALGLPSSDSPGRLAFTFGVPSGEAVARLRAGQCSIAVNPNPVDAEPLRSDPSFAATSRSVPMLSTYVLVFNCHRGPFVDVATRRAVASALDVDGLARGLGRAVTRARSLLPPGLLGHDVEGARSRRSEPQISLDLDVSFLLAPVFRARYERYGRAMIEALAELGIRARVREGLPFNQTEQCDLFLGRWVADYPDPDTFMYGTLHSIAGMWSGLLGNPELDGLIQRVRFDPDPTQRAASCRDIEALLADQTCLVPLFHDRLTLFAHPTVRGLTDDVLRSTGMIAFEALRVED